MGTGVVPGGAVSLGIDFRTPLLPMVLAAAVCAVLYFISRAGSKPDTPKRDLEELIKVLGYGAAIVVGTLLIAYPIFPTWISGYISAEKLKWGVLLGGVATVWLAVKSLRQILQPKSDDQKRIDHLEKKIDELTEHLAREAREQSRR